jgi:hypothetical protein
MRTRVVGAVATLVTLAAVLWPMQRQLLSDDSFPLSTYPMFALRRTGARLYLEYFVAIGPHGLRRFVPPELVASPEVMQTLVSIHAAVARGDTDRLCRRVATRVRDRREFAGTDTLTLVAGRHAAIDYLVRGIPGTETVLVACAIDRRRP